jgi:hypothetical protein
LQRKETWVGKKTAVRGVYSVKFGIKDPTKVAHHKHLSFELTFIAIGDEWHAQIVPSWFFSYNGIKEVFWHDDLLSKQKRLEHNATVRNQVRFIAYFLAATADDKTALAYGPLAEFGVEHQDRAEPVGDDDETALAEEGVAS